MSQNPSPYSPPQLSSRPGSPGSLSIFHKASILVIILGAICFLLGLSPALTQPPAEAIAQGTKYLADHKENLPPGYTPEQCMSILLKAMRVVGFLMLGVGLLMALAGILVRQGHKGATIFATILCAGLVLLTGIYLLVGLAKALQGDQMGILVLVVMSIPFAMFLLATTWLVQAWKASSRVVSTRQGGFPVGPPQTGFAQQAYGYGYNPQGYSSQGYAPPQGYGAVPRPAPPENAAPAVRHPPLPPEENQNP